MQPGGDRTARQATAADAAQLDRLHQAARRHIADLRGGSVLLSLGHPPMAPTAAFADEMGSADSLVLVGELDGLAVGYAVARRRTLAGSDDTLVDVTDLFVDAPFRRIGMGHRLMSEIIEWAIGLGASGVDAQVLPGDRASKNFFEGFGLVARAISVHRSLEPTDER